jgi:hypothetical protein
MRTIGTGRGGWRRAVLACGLALLVAGAGAVQAKDELGGGIGEIVRLLEAEVGEEVIRAFIAKAGAGIELTADDIVALKRAGASEALIVAILKAGAADGPAAGGSVAAGFPVDLDAAHRVGAPLIHGAIAVYPVLRRTPTEIGAYLTLDEAVRQDMVVIVEQGGGSVPVVLIRNRGRLPVYIAAGEIIVGGKQDRMVAYSVIIHPDKELTVEVRCVEQGRWSGGRDGKFASAFAMGGRKTRGAVQLRGQSEVWQEVATKNAELGVAPAGGSYLAAVAHDGVARDYEAYARALLPHVGGPDVVGMVVAIGGEPHAIDIFGSPSLFARMREKILKACVLDVAGADVADAPPPGPERILAFFRELTAAQARELKSYERNSNQVRENAAAFQVECLDEERRQIHINLMRK